MSGVLVIMAAAASGAAEARTGCQACLARRQVELFISLLRPTDAVAYSASGDPFTFKLGKVAASLLGPVQPARR
jgi:hypothetical protein